MQHLADRLVELHMIDAISDETVRRTLRKKERRAWQRAQWRIPTVGPDVVCRMEDVLDHYA